MLNERSVEFIVRVPESLSDADLAKAVEDSVLGLLEGLGGELLGHTVTLLDEDNKESDEDDEGSDEDFKESDEDFNPLMTQVEQTREKAVRSRNEFVIRARESQDYHGRGVPPTLAEVTEMIRQYDQENPL